MKRPLFAAFVLVILVTGLCRAQEDAAILDVDKFADEIRKLVIREYPKANITVKDSIIHFEFNVRKYMIHEPLLTGEWQDAHEEIGPQRGGIFCDMEFRKHNYGAQAAVPQDFDKRYFKTLLMAPYSKKLDHHLYVHFKYPSNVKPEFSKKFQTLTERFEEFCSTRRTNK